MNYSLLSPEALSTLNVLTSKDGSLQQHSSNGDIEHHIVTTSMKTEQDSFVSCSQGGNPLGTTMVSMTGVANHHPHAAAVPGNIVTMTASPNTLAEQLLVAVQNMNGNPGTLDGSDDGKVSADVGLTSLNSSAAAAAVGPQLASILGLAGLPQVAALAGIPGLANLGVVGQLAAAAQVVQAAANNANVGNGNITLTPGNAQQQTLQQVAQLNPAAMHHASTPQFIFAGGQPIQGIQGAQLLIPTSSGVATQQIITIPVTQMMTNQMVQFVANNGQVLTTSLANLQAFNQSLSLANPQTASANANGSGGQMHNSSMISSGTFPGLNNQVTTLPQILTNAAGQVIAITPQLIAHQMISNTAANNIPVSAASIGTMHMSHQHQQHQAQQQQQHHQQQQQQHNHSQITHSEKEHSPIPHLNGSTITIAQKPTSSIPMTSLASSPMSSNIISSLSSTAMNTLPVSSGSLTSALTLQPSSVQSPTGQQLTLNPASVMVAATAAHLSSVQAKAQSSTQCISPQQQQRLQHGSPGSISSSSSGTVSALTQTVMTQSVSSTTPSSTLESTVALINQSISRREADSFLSSADTINNTEANIVDGINLEEIKEFAKVFKIRRLSLGLTQTQVGQALSATEGPSYSQSAICRFEKLDITPKSAQKIKPVLERWMKEAEERYKNGDQNLTDFIGSEPSKKRKRRTSFTPTALEILNQFFEKNTHPSGSEMTELAERLNYDREVVRVWFCNKRQALKNTIKRLKGGMV